MSKRMPPGRRAQEKGEVAFVMRRRKRCGTHRLIAFDLGRGETVAACGVCGKLKRGVTLPDWHKPVTA